MTARLSARNGGITLARQSIQEARALMSTDAVCDRARMELSVARVLETLGDADGAASAVTNARRLFVSKGNLRAVRSVDEHGAAALT